MGFPPADLARIGTTRPVPPRAERIVLREILAFLKLQPGLFWRNNTGIARFARTDGSARTVVFGVPGLSDIVGVLRVRAARRRKPVGLFVAIEVKRDGGKLTVQQQLFLEIVRDQGGLGIVARSVAEVAEAFALARTEFAGGV